jgi:tetratricopeptide (TPR) repeat protein
MARARSILLPAALLAPICALFAGPALGDELVLKNGRTLEGEVVEAGDVVTFKRPGISMEIRRDEVQEIRKSLTAKEQYAKKAETLAKADGELDLSGSRVPHTKTIEAAEAHHRLGLWCATKGLKDEALAEQKSALLLDPDHAGARRALGFVKTDAGWRPEADVMKEKGLVPFEGRWVTKEEAASLAKGGEPSAAEKARREKRDRERGLKKSLNAALKLVAAPDAAQRVEGERALVAVAKEMADPGLEARAPEIRTYYDQAYEEISRARALIQVRAQVVTLKRPIKSFQTSLGGFTTPVTLQLPELSIISVNTTALVPLGIEED